MNKLKYLLLPLLIPLFLFGQMPYETFVGTKKASFDLLFSKPLLKKDNQASRFSIFTRNRVEFPSFENKSNKPFFLSLNALSFKVDKLHNAAPVLVAQVDNFGFYLKAGLQWFTVGKNYFLFTWGVFNLYNQPLFDHFMVFRWFPKVSDKLTGFIQLESINVVPLEASQVKLLMQRFRIGPQMGNWQLGLGVDHVFAGVKRLNSDFNPGIFGRYTF